MDLGLQGARVLVAASSQGLGAATARRFSLEGARVVINGRDADKLATTAQAIAAETGNEVIPVAADLASPGGAEHLVRETVARLGGLDVLVTNAGGPPPGTFESVALDDWERAFHLTVMSAVRLIRASLPHLREGEQPAILTITSVSIKEPIDNLILSNSVRMAVGGLTKSLARELGPEGIRVNSILPGWTRTERVSELMAARAEKTGRSADEMAAEQSAGTPLGRMGEPDEFANVAVFLCSRAASYVHGTLVPVDGGAIRATL